MGLNIKTGEPQERLGMWIRMMVFLGVLFFIVYHYVDPKLIFHAHGQYLIFPIESPGMHSSSGRPVVPGSAAVHLAAHLAYYFHSSWIGTAIVTGTGALLSVGTLVVMAGARCRRWRPLIYVPPLILLAQFAHYCPVFLADSLATVLALFLAYAVIRGAQHGLGLGLGTFIVCSILMYATAVQGYLVFTVLTTIAAFFMHRRFAAGAGAVLWGCVLPGSLGYACFSLDLPMAYRCLWPSDYQGNVVWIGLYAGLVGFFLLVALACLAEPWLDRRKEMKSRDSETLAKGSKVTQPRSKEDKSPGKSRFSHRGAVRWALGSGCLLVVTGAVWHLSFQRNTAIEYRINYYALKRQWPALLAAAEALPRDRLNLFVCHDVNRALYHTGRLAYDMFKWPQHVAGLLLTPSKRPAGRDIVFHYAKRGDVLYELGHVNQAERITCEAVELAQYHPEGLRRLAMIKAAKGQMAAARIYLKALSQDRVTRRWAQQWLDKMATDPNLDGADEVQRIRSFMLTKDTVGTTTPLELFQHNPRNHMAFEYLMAFSMLTRQPGVVGSCLGYLDQFGYPKGQIPRHYAEAVLLSQLLSNQNVDLGGRTIDRETSYRFNRFVEEYRRFEPDRQAAATALAKDYGDTYYYYFLLGDPAAGGNP